MRIKLRTLLLACCLCLSACVNGGSNSQFSTEYNNIRLASYNATKRWLTHHHSHVERMALIEGVGALTAYADLDDISTGDFFSYIIGHDMDITDRDAALTAARFLSELTSFQTLGEGMMTKSSVHGAILNGILQAV